jgi:hypothetical protein
MSIHRRLERLEAQNPNPAELTDFGDAWPLDDQLAQVADMLDFFISFHSRDTIRYQATDRELHLLGLLCAANGSEAGDSSARSPGGLPEWTREHFERMDPKEQPHRDRRLFEMRSGFEPWREKVRRAEEEQQRRSAESKRCSRELLERNRVSVGLPPLTPEQVEEYGLQGTEA